MRYHLKGLNHERLSLSIKAQSTCTLTRTLSSDGVDCGVIIEGEHRQTGDKLSVSFWWTSGFVDINDTVADGAKVSGNGLWAQGNEAALEASLASMKSGSVVVRVMSDKHVPKIEISSNSNVVPVLSVAETAKSSITSGSGGDALGSVGGVTKDTSLYTQ